MSLPPALPGLIAVAPLELACDEPALVALSPLLLLPHAASALTAPAIAIDAASLLENMPSPLPGCPPGGMLSCGA